MQRNSNQWDYQPLEMSEEETQEYLKFIFAKLKKNPLRQRREYLYLSQEKLAKLVGCTRYEVSRMENGKMMIRDNVHDILELYANFKLMACSSYYHAREKAKLRNAQPR